MKERPIICRDDEVRAFLDGRKTQMRRPMRSKRVYATGGTLDQTWLPIGRGHCITLSENGKWPRSVLQHCPFGVVGDRLWVRECFTPNHGPDSTSPEHCIYRADDNRGIEDISEVRWTPSSQMLRWASRITLEITSVRVERLQGITEDDARSEGVYPQFAMNASDFGRGVKVKPTHTIGFKHELDDAYNSGPGRYNSAKPQKPFAWVNNPFVWVIGVEVRT